MISGKRNKLINLLIELKEYNHEQCYADFFLNFCPILSLLKISWKFMEDTSSFHRSDWLIN